MGIISILTFSLIALLGMGLFARGAELGWVVWGVRPAFVLMALIAITALLTPEPYRDLARGVLRATGSERRIEALDEAFVLDDLAVELDARARSLLDRVGGLLGGGADSDTLLPELPAGVQAGFFENEVYPVVVLTVAWILRASALLLSLAGMVALVALDIAARAAASLSAERARVGELEARIQLLEHRAGMPSGTAE